MRLSPLIAEEQEKIAQVIVDLVNDNLKPTYENLAKATGGSLQLTRGVVEALHDEPDASVLMSRLSGEMAQALMACRSDKTAPIVPDAGRNDSKIKLTRQRMAIAEACLLTKTHKNKFCTPSSSADN